MANEKSKAEQYRDERKARIAETAKKNAKNMEKKNTAKKVAGRVVSIVLAVAIVVGILGYSLNYYGVFQRLTPIGGVGEDQNVSVAEYEYYYMDTYNRLIQQVEYYSNSGYNYGYDTSVSPEEQTQTTTDADGKEITWVEYLHDNAIKLAQMNRAYYNEAKKSGLELDDADKASVDTQIEAYRDQAKGTSDTTQTSKTTPKSYSLNAFLRKTFGGSINERYLRKILEVRALAVKYYQTKTKSIEDGYTQKVIDEAYSKDKDTYDLVTFRVYKFQNSKLTKEDNESETELAARQKKADAEVKKNVEDFYSAVKDEKTFLAKATEINKSTDGYDADSSTKFTMLKSSISQNYSEDMSKWLYDSATKQGDKKLLTDAESGVYYVVLMIQGKHQSDTASARHILFMTVDSSTGQALSDDKVKEAKQKAEDALKTWQEGDKTEDSFAALASELTEDQGSQSTGGLYENIYPGQMTGEFNDWVFDAGRKAGDTEIIKTSYGYHVMYYVKNDKKPYYDSAIRSSKAETDVEKEATELLDGDTYKVGFGPRRTDYAEKQAMKKINYLLQLKNANKSSSSYGS